MLCRGVQNGRKYSIFHNYPPTNSNIGSAAGMDSPESIRLLLAKMRELGYKIDSIPEDSQSFMNELIALNKLSQINWTLSWN